MAITESLFPEMETNNQKEIQEFVLPGSRVVLFRNYYSYANACDIFLKLKNKIEWNQDEITLYGKKIPLPRLTAWYGDPGIVYDYSGIIVKSIPWTNQLQDIRSTVQKATGNPFNSVLLNYYRSGRDGVAWHSDDEPVLGENPIIASASFGYPRKFQIRHKQTKELLEFELGNGDILLMDGQTQKYCEHQVPKTKKNVDERINLTFRYIPT